MGVCGVFLFYCELKGSETLRFLVTERYFFPKWVSEVFLYRSQFFLPTENDTVRVQ